MLTLTDDQREAFYRISMEHDCESLKMLVHLTAVYGLTNGERKSILKKNCYFTDKGVLEIVYRDKVFHGEKTLVIENRVLGDFMLYDMYEERMFETESKNDHIFVQDKKSQSLTMEYCSRAESFAARVIDADNSYWYDCRSQRELFLKYDSLSKFQVSKYIL